MSMSPANTSQPIDRPLQLFLIAVSPRPSWRPDRNQSLAVARALGSSWGPLSEVDIAEIGAVDLCMAKGACLVLRRLVVERRRAGRSAEHRIRVARDAEQIYGAIPQQVLVGSPVGHMAGLAALGLDRFVLEYERTLLIGMALKADSALFRRVPHLLRQHGAVWVVAVIALNQAIEHAMAEGHVELRLLSEMAGEAQLVFWFCQEKFLRFGVMR